MRTLRTQIHDDHELITGFDTLHIDPMASRRLRAELFESSDEWKALKPKLERLRALRDEYCNAKKIKKDSVKKAARAAIQVQIDNIAIEIQDMKEAVENKKAETHEQGTVRFSCRKGEVILEEHELKAIEEKFHTLSPGEYLLTTGEIIVDNRGKTFWRKVEGAWEKQVVTRIGEKIKSDMNHISALGEDDTREIQITIEIERISKLQPEQKIEEKAHVLDVLAGESVRLRSQYEIQKTTNPLGEAQAWYEGEKAKIELIYG